MRCVPLQLAVGALSTLDPYCYFYLNIHHCVFVYFDNKGRIKIAMDYDADIEGFSEIEEQINEIEGGLFEGMPKDNSIELIEGDELPEEKPKGWERGNSAKGEIFENSPVRIKSEKWKTGEGNFSSGDKKTKLNDKQLLFLENYLQDPNLDARNTARKMGYAEGTAMAMHRLVQSTAFREEMNKRIKKVQRKTDIDLMKLLHTSNAIATTPLSDVLHIDKSGSTWVKDFDELTDAQKLAIKEILPIMNKEGDVVGHKVKMKDSRSSARDLYEMTGLTPEQFRKQLGWEFNKNRMTELNNKTVEDAMKEWEKTLEESQ